MQSFQEERIKSLNFVFLQYFFSAMLFCYCFSAHGVSFHYAVTVLNRTNSLYEFCLTNSKGPGQICKIVEPNQQYDLSGTFEKSVMRLDVEAYSLSIPQGGGDPKRSHLICYVAGVSDFPQPQTTFRLQINGSINVSNESDSLCESNGVAFLVNWN